MAKKVAAKAPPQRTPPNKRKSTRYAPDPGAIALILTDAKGQKLEVPIPCLIVEESYTGCGLMALKDSFIKKNAIIEVQIGRLPKMKGEIRWFKSLEDKFVYFGLAYQT